MRFLEDKFIPEPNSGCWLWERATTAAGYGVISIDGKLQYAHRLSYRIHYGPIPHGLLICHKCDIPQCINPNHLFIGASKDNTVDMFRKRRNVVNMLFGENHGNAKLTNEQVRMIRLDNRSYRKIAAMYGVAYCQIQRIKSGRGWRHVQ
jgi:hypothetical protein